MYIKKDRKLVYTKLGKDINIVKLSSIYPNNCSEKEYEVVSDDVLQALIDSDKYFARQERYIRGNESAFPYDDGIGKQPNVLVEEEQYSFDLEELEQQRAQHFEEIRRVFEQLTDKQRARVYLHIKFNLTYMAIAEIEGVTTSAVQDSCNSAYHILSKYSAILLKRTSQSWVDLLKPTNMQKIIKKFPNKP